LGIADLRGFKQAEESAHELPFTDTSSERLPCDNVWSEQQVAMEWTSVSPS